jgi:hypothetical protein
MDIATLIVTVLFGLLVLTSYYIVFAKLVTGSYLKHKFWLGINTSTISVLFFFQILAACGFIASSTTWIVDPPTTGVMGNNVYALPVTISVLLITAIIWPFATYYKIPWLTVLSLIGTAASSIVLLAGAIEEDNPRWWVVLGWMLLCLVTVLGDGVVWNAKYILTLKNNPDYFNKW